MKKRLAIGLIFLVVAIALIGCTTKEVATGAVGNDENEDNKEMINENSDTGEEVDMGDIPPPPALPEE